MTTTCIGFLFGRTLWTRAGSGWSQSGKGEWERDLEDALRRHGRAQGTSIVFEPQTVAHEKVDGCYASRAQFAKAPGSLERVTCLGDPTLAWGIDSPGGETASERTTMVHYEIGPGLGRFASGGGSFPPLAAAWSLASLAAALAGPAGSARVVVLTEGYAALASWGRGIHAFSSWLGQDSAQPWTGVSQVLADLASVARGGDGRPSAGLWVFSQGELSSLSGFIDRSRALFSSVRTGDFDALAAVVSGLSDQSPANMALAFPRSIDLTKPIRRWMLATAILTLVFLVIERQMSRANALSEQSSEAMEGQLASVVARQEANREAMNRLTDVPRQEPVRVSKVLAMLGSALPASWVIEKVELNGHRLEMGGVAGTGGDRPSELPREIAAMFEGQPRFDWSRSGHWLLAGDTARSLR